MNYNNNLIIVVVFNNNQYNLFNKVKIYFKI